MQHALKRLAFLSACLALAAGTTRAAPPAQGPVRVIAVQPKIDLAHCDTYAHFRGHLQDLVQEQVVPRLAPDQVNLVVFPEDVGLPAAFIGSRAAGARAQATVYDAYAGLFMGDPPPYGMALYYYALAMPGLPPERLPVLALTDTLWRAFYETMRDIAVQTGAWVVASTNVSRQVEMSVDPLEMFLLSDPDLGIGPVYVARDPDVYNTAFVFSPAGEIVAAARKPYPVPAEEDLLRFAYGPLADVRPVDLGFARLGIVTSKDAWMPDVLDRLAILGTDMLVQPEAFGGWTIFDDPAYPEDWLPDNVLQSGWQAVQKYGAFRWGVIPHLTGNLFDWPFDGQSALLADAVPGQTGPAYVGQDPSGGFLAVAPWVVPDPMLWDPSLTLAARREFLRMVGFSLLPGFPNANAYIETALSADMPTASPYPAEPRGRPGVLGRSMDLAPCDMGEQGHAAVATDGHGGVVVAWQDTRDGLPQVYLAVSRNGGNSFTPALRLAPSSNPQRTPAVVLTPRSLYVAWQEEAEGERRIVVTRSGHGALRFEPPAALPTDGPADEWMPVMAWDGSRPGQRRDSAVYLAFVQTRDGNERVQVAHAPDGTREWQITPADPDPPAYPAPNYRNNQWAPAIAARGEEVAVAWVGCRQVDARNYGWDVLLSRSTDGATTFGAPVRVDDAPDSWERVHADPTLAFMPGGALLCGWSDVRQRQAATQARAARVTDAFGPSVVLAAGAGAGASSWRPRFAVTGEASVAAVWQDFRALGNDICLAVSADGGATFGPELRVDDGGDGPSYQFSPQIAAVKPGRLLALWEDTRSGRRQLRYAAGFSPR